MDLNEEYFHAKNLHKYARTLLDGLIRSFTINYQHFSSLKLTFSHYLHSTDQFEMHVMIFLILFLQFFQINEASFLATNCTYEKQKKRTVEIIGHREDSILTRVKMVDEQPERYWGALRFQFACSNVLKDIIGGKTLRFDVFDETLGLYATENFHYEKPFSSKMFRKKAGWLQFRKQNSGESELLGHRSGSDGFLFEISGIGNLRNDSDIRSCVKKVRVHIFPDDGLEPGKIDYTKCLSYKKYKQEIDWGLSYTTTTTQTTILCFFKIE